MLTGNAVARVGFVLFGVYLLVRFLATLIDAFADSPIQSSGDGFSLGAILTNAGAFLGVAFVVGLLLAVLPAVVLISRSQRWADRLFPPRKESASTQRVSYIALFGVGATLLGLSFAIAGLASFVFGLIGVFLADDFMSRYAWQRLGSSAVQLLCGVLLIVSGRRAIRSDAA